MTYNDFINRLDCVVNAVAPFKTVGVKSNTSEWFDREIADTRDKLYKRFLSYMLIKKSIRKHET